MKKYYDDDTGGKYLIGTCGVGYFADVQTITQAVAAARMWWRMTGCSGGIVIRERDGRIVKVMRREAEEEE